MRPIKTYAWKLWCLWNGHVPVPGVRHSDGSMCWVCDHCHRILP